jgi:N-dimethylarginine dimethylaminohydrolase
MEKYLSNYRYLKKERKDRWMKIQSHNEWGRLRSIVVGSATKANWPSDDPVFSQESDKTSWKETPVPSGPVPNWIVDETNEDLEKLVDAIEKYGAEVIRPSDMDFVRNKGMYNYCPRDRVLIAGNTVVDVAMMYPCRDQEIENMYWLVTHDHRYLTMPRDRGMICDAANISRLGENWLFLESASGNDAARTWLQNQFPDIQIHPCNFYSGVHIDSTVVPLRDGLVMLNASRITPSTVPRCLESWDKIWITDEDVVAQDFYQYPYASKWIAMNCLSLDSQTVIVDAAQHSIIKKIEAQKITVIPLTLRHSRTLGGGFHCVTLDLWRQDD